MGELARCHRGHETDQALWDCPVCMSVERAAAHQLAAVLTDLVAMHEAACQVYGVSPTDSVVEGREALEAWDKLTEPGAAGDELLARIDKLETRLGSLRSAAATVCDGFTTGVFQRSIRGDGDGAWAIRLLPYIRALGVLEAERPEELKGWPHGWRKGSGCDDCHHTGEIEVGPGVIFAPCPKCGISPTTPDALDIEPTPIERDES